MWQTLEFSFAAMAAPCSILLDTCREPEARRAAEAAIAEVRRIERKYSRYRADSALSHINREAAHAALAVDDETASLLDFAAQLWQLSAGGFDITSGALRRVWNFEARRVPTVQALQDALACVGWPLVAWDGERIAFNRPGMEIDLGGIGKEYAADRAAHCLRSGGIDSALVNLGGDIHVLGPRRRPDCQGQPWHIAIRHPRQSGAVLAQLPLHRGGLTTSGDYERFFELDGRRCCHILDPRNGQPVTHWQSVSVLSANATSAGALSTLAMLKQDDALPWLNAQGAAYLAVRHDGAVYRRSAQAPDGS